MCTSKRLLVQLAAVGALAVVLSGAIIGAVGDEQARQQDETGASQRHKMITMPSSLARFLMFASPSARERALASSLMGYKRSSAALDSLSGVTIGKRASIDPFNGVGIGKRYVTEMLNLEPYFARQIARPRQYVDFRWTPYEDLEVVESR